MAEDRESLEIAKTLAEISKLEAETAKIQAEAEKLKRERFFYPLVVSGGIAVAVVGVAKLFL
ncbi:MAG: hypothetical protein ACPGNV_00920 [Mangrovicoccus sp.]